MLLLSTIILATLCLLTLTGFLSRLWWLFDITAHFRVQYGLLLAAFAVGFLIAAEPVQCGVASGIAAIFAAINLALVTPLYFGGQRNRCSNSEPSLRILSANVEKSNDRQRLVVELVRDVDPDIVVLAEIGDEWVTEIGGQLPEYPHVVFGSAGARAFGIAMFSRLPLAHSETIDTGEIGAPVVVGRCRIGEREVTVIGAHPVPPFNARWHAARRKYLEELAAIVGRTDGEAIIVGDLNTTSWTPAFRALCRDAALRDSRRGFGVQPSWPSRLWPLRVPIDHCLVSEGLCVVHRRVERHVGSDHRPIVVDVRVWS